MTTRKVLRRRRAWADIDAAIDHYSSAGEQVAIGFIDALDAALDLMVAYPQAGSSRHDDDAELKGLRFRPLDRYPYLIFYFDLGDTIDVWRVLHASVDIPRHLSGS